MFSIFVESVLAWLAQTVYEWQLRWAVKQAIRKNKSVLPHAGSLSLVARPLLWPLVAIDNVLSCKLAHEVCHIQCDQIKDYCKYFVYSIVSVHSGGLRLLSNRTSEWLALVAVCLSLDGVVHGLIKFLDRFIL